MTSVPERPPIDPRDLFPPAEAEQFIDALARVMLAAARVLARRAAEQSVEAEPPASKPKRTRRPSPSKLAKWEAAWQAEQADAEVER